MEKKSLLILYLNESDYIRSVSDCLKNSYTEKFEVIELNPFNETGKQNTKFLSKIKNPQVSSSRGFYNKLKQIGGPKFMGFNNTLYFSYQISKVVSSIKSVAPDMILSSNYFLNYCAIRYKNRFNKCCKVISYNEELMNHKWWDNKYNIFITNNDIAFYDAIGLKRFSPALVRQVKQSAPNYILNFNTSKESCREFFNIKPNSFTILIDKYSDKTIKIIKWLSKIKSDLHILIFISDKQPYKKIRKNLLKFQKNNINFSIIKKNLELSLFAYKASDIFLTSTNYADIKSSLYCGTPILIYKKCSWGNPINRFFIHNMKSGLNSFMPLLIKLKIESWIKNQEELDVYRNNIKKVYTETSGIEEIAKILVEESTRPAIKVSDNEYTNMLYELASEEKYDISTTPINIFSQKELLSYEQIRKKNFFTIAYSWLIKGILKTLAPIVNYFGFNIKIEGRKNLKNIKSGVTISNHVNYLDCLWNFQTLMYKKNVYFTGAPFNFKRGLFGGFLKAAGFIPLAISFSQKKEFDKYVSDILGKGGFVHFYPEQAMWLNYEQSRPLKKGAFYFASKNNVPVIPIFILFREKKFGKGRNVTIKVCEPIYPNSEFSVSENTKFLNEKAQEVYDNTIIDFYHYDKSTYAMNKVQKKTH